MTLVWQGVAAAYRRLITPARSAQCQESLSRYTLAVFSPLHPSDRTALQPPSGPRVPRVQNEQPPQPHEARHKDTESDDHHPD